MDLSLATWVAQVVENPPVMQETQVQSLGQEDPLEKGRAANTSIPVWRIPGTEEPGGLKSMGRKESNTTEQLTLSLASLVAQMVKCQPAMQETQVHKHTSVFP